MAVAFETYTTATADYAGGSGNLSVNPPSGLTTGDVWFIDCTADRGFVGIIGLASGFTPVSAAIAALDDSGAWPEIRGQWKAAGAGEAAVTVPFASGSFEVHAVSQRWSGANATSPVGNISRGDDAGAASNPDTVTPASLSVASAGSAVKIHLGFTPNGSALVSVAQSSGYTEIVEVAGTTNQCCIEVAYLLRGAGTETPGAITITTAGASPRHMIAQAIEIKPALVPPYNVSRPTLDAALAYAGLTSTELRNAAAWF